MPPSAFDILGVLSFAQGVITVIIAGILAFRALTEQTRKNMDSLHQLHRRMEEVVTWHYLLPPEVQPEGDVIQIRQRSQEAVRLLERLRVSRHLGFLTRWFRSGENASEIEEISTNVARFEADLVEMRMNRAISNAVDQIVDRAIRASHELFGGRQEESDGKISEIARLMDMTVGIPRAVEQAVDRALRANQPRESDSDDDVKMAAVQEKIARLMEAVHRAVRYRFSRS
ncbi:hypothetical protein B0H11DRAFT_1938883 [Mycena galericulata]|nr:hypothetical protein B0H11DRAFT_1938883 [Mycena galericulata]